MLVHLLIITSNDRISIEDSGRFISVRAYETRELAKASRRKWLETYNDVEVEIIQQIVNEHVVMPNEIKERK